MLGGFSRSGEQPSLPLVLESEALAVDADNDRVMQYAVEHRRSEHCVTGESGIPTAEGEVRSEDHRAAFIALRHDLKEQVGLLAAHRQIADLIDDQQLVGVDCAMHGLSVTALTLGRFQHQNQIRCAEEASLVSLLRGQIPEGDREMSLAHAGGPEEHPFSARSTKARLASSMICLRGAPVAKLKSY